jgi:hypothetical protein
MVAVKSIKPGNNTSWKNKEPLFHIFLIGFGAPAGVSWREFFLWFKALLINVLFFFCPVNTHVLLLLIFKHLLPAHYYGL